MLNGAEWTRVSSSSLIDWCVLKHMFLRTDKSSSFTRQNLCSGLIYCTQPFILKCVFFSHFPLSFRLNECVTEGLSVHTHKTLNEPVMRRTSDGDQNTQRQREKKLRVQIDTSCQWQWLHLDTNPSALVHCIDLASRIPCSSDWPMNQWTAQWQRHANRENKAMGTLRWCLYHCVRNFHSLLFCLLKQRTPENCHLVSRAPILWIDK